MLTLYICRYIHIGFIIGVKYELFDGCGFFHFVLGSSVLLDGQKLNTTIILVVL